VYWALRGLPLSGLLGFLAARLPCPLAQIPAVGVAERLLVPEMQAHY
jgi:hypothetical protein